MTQAKLSFDLPRAEAHKTSGMDAAAKYRKGLLSRAQAIAHKLAADGRSITCDDVFEALDIGSDAPLCLGPAWGSVFRGKDWVMVGWRKSKRVSNHARAIRIWRLR